MSLRVVPLLVAFVMACGGDSMRTKKGEPQTAREKMLAEEKEHPTAKDEQMGGGKWSGWRYQGDRKDCFFVFGRKCYKSEKAACQAAHCKGATKCTTEGAGPATVKCEKS
jgi:hypothetical protein